MESHQKLMEEHNKKTSLEMWEDPNRHQEHMEKLKRINEKKIREKADVRYEAAHLREYKEYRKYVPGLPIDITD